MVNVKNAGIYLGQNEANNQPKKKKQGGNGSKRTKPPKSLSKNQSERVINKNNTINEDSENNYG